MCKQNLSLYLKCYTGCWFHKKKITGENQKNGSVFEIATPLFFFWVTFLIPTFLDIFYCFDESFSVTAPLLNKASNFLFSKYYQHTSIIAISPSNCIEGHMILISTM